MLRKDIFVDGVRWRVIEEEVATGDSPGRGTGEPLVFVHGFFSSSFTWLKVLPYFSKHYRVICVDLPGFGFSERPKGFDHSAGGEAKVLARFFEVYGIRRATVVGNSMGGAISMIMASEHPSLVERLILVTSVTPWTKPIPSFQTLRTPILGELSMLFLSRAAIERSLKWRLFADSSKVTPETVSGWYEPMRIAGSRRAALSMIRSSAAGYEDLPSRVQCPALVIACTRDRLIPWQEEERLSKALPKGELSIFEGIGHLPQEEVPELFAKTVLSYLGYEIVH